MESPLFLSAVVLLFCTTGTAVLSLTQQTIPYLFYQYPVYPKDCRDINRQCSSSTSSGVYLIKPKGYHEPFEVFCDNNVGTGGWTVVQRREHDFLDFNRTWSQYRDGFGFLSTEFWLGNEKLAYMTNQAVYELLIEVQLSDGSSFYTTYGKFRISDNTKQYTLQGVGNFKSNGSSALSPCPSSEYFSDDCTQYCTCSNTGLNCNTVSCDTNAVCSITHRGVGCSCNAGYTGDGLTCAREYSDCQDVYDDGHTESGLYLILPNGWTSEPFQVFCEMNNGEGWTVFQRRKNDTTNFARSWTAYKNGFGDATESFWLGNEKLYYMTNQKEYQLRLDIVTSNGTTYGAAYTEFQIESEASNYTMNKLGTRSDANGGYVGRDLYQSIGAQFSTFDRDNDGCDYYNCAAKHQSGWWHIKYTSCKRCAYQNERCIWFNYNNCYSLCTHDNLNGIFEGGNGEMIFSVSGGHYCDIQFVEMKIRPNV